VKLDHHSPAFTLSVYVLLDGDLGEPLKLPHNRSRAGGDLEVVAA
jgi:hypothetical protein